jgi:signal transduction histidine kinase
MNTSNTALLNETKVPLTHIFLSVQLMETFNDNEEYQTYLTIIRQNTERLQNLIRDLENYKMDKPQPMLSD